MTYNVFSGTLNPTHSPSVIPVNCVYISQISDLVSINRCRQNSLSVSNVRQLAAGIKHKTMH